MIPCTKEHFSLGIISDTHGVFHPKITELFKGVDYIIHAGDIGSPDIIQSLSEIAPVLAILGNADSTFLFPHLNETETFEAPDFKMYVIHNLDCMDFDPKTVGFDVIISGHSHRSAIYRKEKTLYINPGSAGSQRFNLPVSLALLHTVGSNIHPEIIEIAT